MVRKSDGLPRNIQNGLKYLGDRTQQAFLRKFQEQSKNRQQLQHTLIELIPGVFGARRGFAPLYEPAMDGQTPDWLFRDQEGKPQFFSDVLNFHMNEAIEKEMKEALRTQPCWGRELPRSEDRLYPSLRAKAAKYKHLAEKVNLPFVIFLYGWFEAFLHPWEIEFCIKDPKDGLFKDYPHLSGVYHFDDATPLGCGWVNPGYYFRFYSNPHASRPMTLIDGLVPLPIPEPS